MSPQCKVLLTSLTIVILSVVTVQTAKSQTPAPQPKLVWQHQTNGLIGVWLMNGTTLIQAPFFNPNQVSDINWKIVGVQ